MDEYRCTSLTRITWYGIYHADVFLDLTSLWMHYWCTDLTCIAWCKINNIDIQKIIAYSTQYSFNLYNYIVWSEINNTNFHLWMTFYAIQKYILAPYCMICGELHGSTILLSISHYAMQTYALGTYYIIYGSFFILMRILFYTTLMYGLQRSVLNQLQWCCLYLNTIFYAILNTDVPPLNILQGVI